MKTILHSPGGLLAAVLLVFLAGCANPSPGPASNTTETTPDHPASPNSILTTTTATPASETRFIETVSIPESIIEKTNQFIVSKVGQEYFTQYFSFIPSKSRYIEARPGENGGTFENDPHYQMAYSFIMPEKSFVNETISVNVDLDGRVMGEEELGGIPDRLNDPQEGEFPIDEQMAIDIAHNAGLEAGIKDWETSFHWYYGEYQTYVWVVTNVLSEGSGGWSGRSVVIDANTGTVLTLSDYQSIAN